MCCDYVGKTILGGGGIEREKEGYIGAKRRLVRRLLGAKVRAGEARVG